MTNQQLIEELEKYPKDGTAKIYDISQDNDFHIRRVEYSDDFEPRGPYIVIDTNDD